MSVGFHPDPASVIARRARLGQPLAARPIVFRPAPAPPPSVAAETAGPVAILPADSAPPARDWFHIATPLTLSGSIPSRLIINSVAGTFGVSLSNILSSRRESIIVYARSSASWLMRRHTRLSLPAIGLRLGGRDHTTVLHAVRRLDKMFAVEGVSVSDDWLENLTFLSAFDRLPYADQSKNPRHRGVRPPRSASSSARDGG